jgi:hypothetical protein
MASLREKFDHPSWFSAGGVLFGYGALLLVMFVLLFVIPFAVFYFVL